MVGWLAMALACKAGEFFFVIDLDFQLTEIWGESKNDSKGQVDPLPALPPYSFKSHFEKKQNKTKQNKNACSAGYIPCTSVYNHKIPFQCFISINSHTDPNFTTTFVKGCFKCQKHFFFQILTNGKLSFYFFADRFEVKKPRFIRAVSEFFL